MRYTLRHGKQMLVFFSVCIVAIVVLFPYLRKERMPEIAHDDALITIDWNAGITPEENNRRMAELLKDVKPFVETSTTMVEARTSSYHIRRISRAVRLYAI